MCTGAPKRNESRSYRCRVGVCALYVVLARSGVFVVTMDSWVFAFERNVPLHGMVSRLVPNGLP
jgi:hypothetical protein